MANVTSGFVWREVVEANKITYKEIEQYLKGTLDASAMHELERRALDDPFLADALEGYSHTDHDDAHLSILQKQLYERIAIQQEKKNIFNFTWQRLSIAAVASLMFISASILFWMKGSQQEPGLALKEKNVDVVLPDSDTRQELTSKEREELSKPGTQITTARPVFRQTPAKTPKAGPLENEPVLASLKKEERSVTLNEVIVVDNNVQADSKPNVSAAASDTMVVPQVIAGRTSGVVIRGRSNLPNESKQANPSFVQADSEPVIGWRKYQRYLRNNRSNPEALIQDTNIIISFTVNRDGRPENFKVVKGLSDAFNNEAIRLVKEGPNWKPGLSETQLSVEFKK
ncbi:energy transducer TonB [Desertivirga xinjiangensis]|uniref:energy transducer TonB n=1 Tax=Desertivirga xinjiangensis TaxID=539206 RepID=UPI00210C4E2B|nr:energy transducer TonB [Pedobacter xinjiangensis]